MLKLSKVTNRIAVDHRGDIYLVEIGDKRIVKMSRDKTVTLTFGSGGTGRGQFKVPLGLATDKNDMIYVADSRNKRIQIFQLTGVEQEALPMTKCEPPMIEYDSSIIAGLRILDIDYIPDDGLYAVTEIDNDLIYRGKKRDIFSKYNEIENRLRKPKGLVFSTKDELYVLDSGNKRIQIFDQEGQYVKEIGGSTDDVQFITPIDIAMDEKDYLYVADQGRHAVIILDQAGKEVLSFGSNGKGPSHFPRLTSIDSSLGKIYVSDYFNAEVKVFDFLAPSPCSDTLLETTVAADDL